MTQWKEMKLRKECYIFCSSSISSSAVIFLGQAPNQLLYVSNFWGSFLSSNPSVITFTATQRLTFGQWIQTSLNLQGPVTLCALANTLVPKLFVNNLQNIRRQHHCTNNLPLFGRLMTKQIIIEVKIEKCKRDEQESKRYLLEYETSSPWMYAGSKDIRGILLQ